jgi:hypothetical protein
MQNNHVHLFIELPIKLSLDGKLLPRTSSRYNDLKRMKTLSYRPHFSSPFVASATFLQGCAMLHKYVHGLASKLFIDTI